MKEIWKAIDSKTITSAGGIVVAMLAIWVMYQVFSDSFSDLTSEVSAHDTTQRLMDSETNEVLRGVTNALEGNTKVLEAVLRTYPQP